jgi:iron complex transport system ATP-binding protein
VADVVEMTEVSVRRTDALLLSDVSWRIREGEKWVVLGPNGAGKTTLLSLAAARMYPTTGSVCLLGEELGLSDVFDLRPRIGLTTSTLADAIPPAEAARDVVMTSAYAVVGRWREAYAEADLSRAQLLLDAMGVGSLAERAFGTLSEGERKRVLIARALMTDPELLLLDEPGAGLDLGGRERLVAALEGMMATPHSPAMVLVTHHVEEVPPGITHALLLRQGAVVASGTLAETMTPANLSACFGLDLRLRYSGGRFSAYAAGPGTPTNPG